MNIFIILDPTFSEAFEKKFKIAEQKLSSAILDEEKVQILQELGNSFHDYKNLY